jgi:hypothetical protein
MAEMDQAELEARVEKAYGAYVAAVGGTDESHRPLARYTELHDVHRGAWRQAVMAALGPVSEAEAQAHRPQGAGTLGGVPAGMSTATTPPAHEEEPSPLRPPATPPAEDAEEESGRSGRRHR